MNTLKRTALLFTSIMTLISLAAILSCNNRFPPSVPATNTYGDSLWRIDHFITNQEAAALINTFRQNKAAIVSGRYNGSNNLLFDHETFNLKDIATLIKTKGCIGLRVNLGMDDSNRVRLVLVAIDANGHEIVTSPMTDVGRSGVGGGMAPPKGKDYLEDGQRWP